MRRCPTISNGPSVARNPERSSEYNTVRKNLILLALCQAMGMTILSMLLSLGGLVGQGLASDPDWATLPVSVQLLFTMLATLPASLLMQRKGRRYGFMLACFILIVAALAAAWAIYNDSYIGFTLSLAGFGVALSFFQFFRFAAIDVAPDYYVSKAVSWVLAGGLLAAFLGPNLAAWTRDFDPAHPFLLTLLSTIPITLLMLWMFWRMDLPLPDACERDGRQRSLRQIAIQPVFFVAVAAAMVAYSVMTLLMTATPLAMKGHGFHFGQTAFIIQWHLVGMFAPSFFSGALIDRFGVLNVMLAGVAAYILVVVLNMGEQSISQYWFALVLLGVGWNFLFIGGTTLLHEAWLPAEKGRVQGINDTLVFSMSALAAIGSGLLYNNLGWEITSLISLPFTLISGALIVYLIRIRRRAQVLPVGG